MIATEMRDLFETLERQQENSGGENVYQIFFLHTHSESGMPDR